MKINIDVYDGRVEYSFNLESGDGNHPDGTTKMKNIPVYFENELISEDTHNDILCLVGILLANPFVSERVSFSIPVSEKFATQSNKIITKYDVECSIDSSISPREMPKDGKPGLAFSGGCDSSAALCVMPHSTVPVFLERPMSDISAYNSDAALTSCDLVSDLGYQMEIVESNFEYIRDPVGFPSDLAHASVLLLIADSLNLDSVNFGTVLESAFGIGHEEFRDYGNGSHWKLFSTLFEIVGIDLSLPVCGVSEVGTALICQKSPFGYINQSCIRGAWKEPCMVCWKCFRKEMLACALGFQTFDKELFSRTITSPDVIQKLEKVPISHENVLSFSVMGLGKQRDKALLALKKRLLPGENLDFLRKWYSPSIYFVTKKYRQEIMSRILSIMPRMNVEESSLVESWDINRFIRMKRTKNNSKRLISMISNQT